MPQGDIFTENIWLLEWVHLFTYCKPYTVLYAGVMNIWDIQK